MLRSVSAIADACGWPIYLLDVKIAFLNSVILEKIYVQKSHNFISKGFEDFVCKLYKAFYSLRQARRAWYECIDLYLIQAG